MELWNLQVQWWLDDGDDYIMMVDGDGSARGCHRELIGAGNVFWWGLSFVIIDQLSVEDLPSWWCPLQIWIHIKQIQKLKNNKYENLFWQIWIESPNISRAVTCVYGSVEFAVAGETVMMMHEMIVMVVVAGQEDRNGFLFALLNFCLWLFCWSCVVEC